MQKPTMRLVEVTDGPTPHGQGGGGKLLKTWGFLALTVGGSAAAWFGMGHAPGKSDPGSEPGMLNSITAQVQDTSATVSDTYARTRTSIVNLGLAQQISTRLRQDKAVDCERLEIAVEEESRVVLTGQVPDQATKEKVVNLTRDTRGVRQVVDQLAVPPRTRIIEAAPTIEAEPEPPVERQATTERYSRFR